jgi:hypothetical protein
MLLEHRRALGCTPLTNLCLRAERATLGGALAAFPLGLRLRALHSVGHADNSKNRAAADPHTRRPNNNHKTHNNHKNKN